MDRRFTPAFLALVGVVVIALTLAGDPLAPDRTPFVARAHQEGTPVAFACRGTAYTILLAPADGADDVLAMYDAVAGRIDQLRDEERIVRTISSLTLADDGTLSIDMRLEAGSEAFIEAVLTRPTLLHVVDGIGPNVEIGSMVTGTPESTVVIDNAELDDAFVTAGDDFPVLHLVLEGPGVSKIAQAVTAQEGAVELAILIDHRLIGRSSIAPEVPTAIAVAIPRLTEDAAADLEPTEVADAMAVALRAGTLPAPADATLATREPESDCL